YMNLCEEITLDFSGVRHANSSFVNAFVSGLVEQHGRIALEKVIFKGANPVLRVLIEGAIELGLQKIEGRIDA
ncbi:MAG TPA: STAS-like domain-containing protein, partial [Opitutaceae bacterium]|nr:STAS-like domain-containing protein [Opitutaceae bacterium]